MGDSVVFNASHLGGLPAGSDGSRKVRRRTVLAAILGLLASPSLPARADAPGQYGHGYRGGYQ